MKGAFSLTTVLLWAVVGVGGDVGPTGRRDARPPVKWVTNRPANIKGGVLVLMYHKVGDEEVSMTRTRQNFRNDLTRLHKMGYRPVTLNEYATKTMKLPPGASPVVITFDDSHSSQFSYLPDGRIDPKSAVGIWDSFAKKHPDFPVKGTFFVLPNGPFVQKGLGAKKVVWLRKQGSEIASHTMTHRPLGRISDGQVAAELAGSYKFLKGLGVTSHSFAPPYGMLPKNRELLTGFKIAGRKQGYKNIVLVGSNPAPSAYSASFKRTRIPRVQAYNGPLGIVYWLNRVSNGKSKPYVQP